MKKIIPVFSFVSVLFLSSCGPAAEDREAMYARAKVFQDSIAAGIKASMDAAAAPATGTGPVVVDTTKAAPTATTK